MRVAWFRFRVTLRHRWGGLLAIMLLVGLVGGVALGSLMGARRTESSFPSYLARDNARTIGVITAIFAPQLGLNRPFDPATVAKVAHLPEVAEVGDFTVVNPNFVVVSGARSDPAPGQAPPTIGGSLDGEYATMDRPTVVQGRLADPKRTNEIVVTPGAVRESGLHVGSVIRAGFFTNAELLLPNCCSADGTGKLRPHVEMTLQVVGIVLLHTEVIEDDVDALHDDWVLLTPALMRKLIPCCAYVTETAIKVVGGDRNVPAVQAELAHALSPLARLGGGGAGDRTSVEIAKAERAIRPESIALAVFGMIAAVAALVIVAQLIGRQLRRGGDEQSVLRALGARPATAVLDSLLGTAIALVTGSLLAGVVAVSLSQLTLLGPVRKVEHPGVAFDWTVLGLGVAALIIALGAIAIVVALQQARPRTSRRARHHRTPWAARWAADAGLPTSATTGVRFALDPGPRTNAVPVRAAMIGTVLAIAVLTATVTFGTSLHTLVTRPRLYGWNWNYQMLSGYSGQEDLPQPQITRLLDHDPDVAAWTGIWFAGARVNGLPVPVIGTSINAAVAPPVLTGHGLDNPNDIVLGAATLHALHKHLGDTVQLMVRSNTTASTLRIVGTATMPDIGASGSHTDMGTGALFDYLLIPAKLRNLQQSSVAGPNAVLVRTRATAGPTAALRSLQQITGTVNRSPESPAGGITSVLRPAEIVNYRALGQTPTILGAGLAIGAIAALALTLTASVRRRQRELALLKTLGFTRRQLAATIAWQSTIATVIGIILGIPLGIIAGRALWNLFAESIHAVPRPAVPALTIALIALAALLLANLIAAVPARRAARTNTATLLLAE